MLLLLAASASCTYYDPGYKELLAVADTKPRKDAIVGMWTRSHPGSLMVHKHSAMEMYRSDGTGLWSLRQSGALSFLILVPDNAKKLTWSADGSGGWHVSHGSGQSAECRMSNGNFCRSVS